MSEPLCPADVLVRELFSTLPTDVAVLAVFCGNEHASVSLEGNVASLRKFDRCFRHVQPDADGTACCVAHVIIDRYGETAYVSGVEQVD